MAKYYVYVLAIWLVLEIDATDEDWLSELQEHLEAEYCVISLEKVEDSESDTASVRTLSMQIQLSFQPSDMDEGEPTEEAILMVGGELRDHLEEEYRVISLEALDDALTSYLLAEEEEADD